RRTRRGISSGPDEWAAIPVNHLENAAGIRQQVTVAGSEFGRLNDMQTFYVPAGTYTLVTGASTDYGSFTVAANGQGSFAISATAGALVPTGNTISIHPTRLAANTINDLTTVAWDLEQLNLSGVGFG